MGEAAAAPQQGHLITGVLNQPGHESIQELGHGVQALPVNLVGLVPAAGQSLFQGVEGALLALGQLGELAEGDPLGLGHRPRRLRLCRRLLLGLAQLFAKFFLGALALVDAGFLELFHQISELPHPHPGTGGVPGREVAAGSGGEAVLEGFRQRFGAKDSRRGSHAGPASLALSLRARTALCGPGTRTALCGPGTRTDPGAKFVHGRVEANGFQGFVDRRGLVPQHPAAYLETGGQHTGNTHDAAEMLDTHGRDPGPRPVANLGGQPVNGGVQAGEGQEALVPPGLLVGPEDVKGQGVGVQEATAQVVGRRIGAGAGVGGVPAAGPQVVREPAPCRLEQPVTDFGVGTGAVGRQRHYWRPPQTLTVRSPRPGLRGPPRLATSWSPTGMTPSPRRSRAWGPSRRKRLTRTACTPRTRCTDW